MVLQIQCHVCSISMYFQCMAQDQERYKPHCVCTTPIEDIGILIAHTRCPRVFANSRVLQNITPKTCTFCNYFAQILSHPISICSLNFGYKKNLVLFPTLKKDEHGVSKVSTNLSKTILEVFK